jgi:hypothetical protein
MDKAPGQGRVRNVLVLGAKPLVFILEKHVQKGQHLYI